MKKGIQKYTICLIASLILVMPFSFNKTIAAEYDFSTMAYVFWSSYGFNTIVAEDSYTVASHNITVPKVYTTETVNETETNPNVVEHTGAGSVANYMTCTYQSSGNMYLCALNTNGQYLYYTQNNSSITGTNSYTQNSYSMTEASYNIIHNSASPVIYLETNGNPMYTVTQFETNHAVNFASNEPYYISFLSYFLNGSGLQIYSQNNVTYTWERVYRNSAYDAINNHQVHHLTYRIIKDPNYTGNDNISINFVQLAGRTDNHIIPVFNGFDSTLDESTRAIIGIGTIAQVGDYISQASTAAADAANNTLGSSVSNLSTIEDQYNQDLNNQLNQIDFTDHITTQQGFLTSSNWVITTFNSLISNNPFTWLIIIVSIFYVFKRFN